MSVSSASTISAVTSDTPGVSRSDVGRRRREFGVQDEQLALEPKQQLGDLGLARVVRVGAGDAERRDGFVHLAVGVDAQARLLDALLAGEEQLRRPVVALAACRPCQAIDTGPSVAGSCARTRELTITTTDQASHIDEATRRRSRPGSRSATAAQQPADPEQERRSERPRLLTDHGRARPRQEQRGAERRRRSVRGARWPRRRSEGGRPRRRRAAPARDPPHRILSAVSEPSRRACRAAASRARPSRADGGRRACRAAPRCRVRARVPTSFSIFAGASDDDPLLRIALDVDDRVDLDDSSARRRRPDLLDDDGDGVRHLLARQLEDLLADQLGDDLVLGLVGQASGG